MKFETEFDGRRRYFATPNHMSFKVEVGTETAPFLMTAGSYTFGNEADARLAVEMVGEILRQVDLFNHELRLALCGDDESSDLHLKWRQAEAQLDESRREPYHISITGDAYHKLVDAARKKDYVPF